MAILLRESNPKIVCYREVLPGDPDQEWTERLIDLCEELSACLDERGTASKSVAAMIGSHLRKRGEK